MKSLVLYQDTSQFIVERVLADFMLQQDLPHEGVNLFKLWMSRVASAKARGGCPPTVRVKVYIREWRGVCSI